jgi:hypothetical protein
MIIGSEKLGDQYGGTTAEADAKTVQQTDQGAGGSYSSQGLGTDETAYDDGIHCIVHLLEKSSQQNGEEKDKQLLPDHTFGNVPGSRWL